MDARAHDTFRPHRTIVIHMLAQIDYRISPMSSELKMNGEQSLALPPLTEFPSSNWLLSALVSSAYNGQFGAITVPRGSSGHL